MFRIISLLLVMIMMSAGRMAAFDTSLYATDSRLASGKWVKIAVPASGIYRITTSDLRGYGFKDPSKVYVYGYGGAQLPAELSVSSYTDDLPPVRVQRDASGIIFYAQGPEQYTEPVRGHFVQTHNIYDTRGYYFLSDCAPADDFVADMPATGIAGADDNAATSCTAVVYHEQNLVSASNNGWLMVGEDFRFTPTRNFTLHLPDRVEGTEVWMQTSFVLKTASPSSGVLSFTANGTTLPQSAADRISGIGDVNEVDGREGLSRRTFNIEGERLNIGIALSVTGSILRANLNYITVNYTRKLRLRTDAPLIFSTDRGSVTLDNAGDKTVVWDITDPADVQVVNTTIADGKASWTASDNNMRSYAAWTSGTALPRPVFVEHVANQNLHAQTETPDMLIITPRQWRAQAERLADFHRHSASDPLKVEVVTDAQIYNEFGSGCSDVGALRKFCKMVYDRGLIDGVLSGDYTRNSQLRYVLLMAAPTYDNRHIEAASNFPTLPAYYPGLASSQLAAETGYGTDDLLAMLDDNAGNDINGDRLRVAVGRIPARSTADATAAVDKIIRYASDNKRTAWKNRVLLVADDGNGAIHAKDIDRMANALQSTETQPYIIDKIYIDAYEFTGGEYPGARADMYRSLDEGVVWWNYVGHANTTSWTSENLLNLNDINTMYLKHPPMLYSATCLFLKWDADITCGGEILFNEPNGGIIGAISATRPVYITPNGNFTEALGATIGTRDTDGRMLTIGEVYRRAKNRVSNLVTMANNHRRFVLMGDPAMRLAVPDYTAVLDAVDGVALADPEAQAIVGAHSNATFSGRITDASGNLLEDFNGVVLADLYDAEQSLITNGNNDKDPVKYSFDKQGGRLFSGAAKVENGRFDIKVSMPSDIADNFRPAALSMYAYTDDADNVREAAGVSRDFYVYGYDDSAPADTEAPVINTCVLNHSGFSEGDAVNPSPMLLASVSDNVALNLSTAGVGHNMSLTLDGVKMYSDVAQYFTPAPDGSPAGSIAYPLDGLTPGEHTLRLRVWDTSGNHATRTIAFNVAEGLAPGILEVFSDANPASTAANFYVRHDRPDSRMELTVTVYDLAGRAVWSKSVTATSDMTLSAPLTWDLNDYAGRRVQRGIYLYRAELRTADGGRTSAARRIAVTAP